MQAVDIVVAIQTDNSLEVNFVSESEHSIIIE